MQDSIERRAEAIRRAMEKQDEPVMTDDQVHRAAHLLTAGKALPQSA